MIIALTVAALGLLVAAATADAAPSPLWQAPEGAPGSGGGAGEIDEPNGVAVDPSTGNVYVADVHNSRIDEFTPWGVFVKAIGWNVDASAPAGELQACTAATSCKAGTSGSGAGQFDEPAGLAVDEDGSLYVVDYNNHRVQKFDSDGNFVLMFGGEVDKDTDANICTAVSGDTCGIGTVGTGNGQFVPWSPFTRGQLVSIGPSGEVFVGDENRIQIFNQAGEYQREIATPSPGAANAVAVDPSGNVYFDFAQSRALGKAQHPNIYRFDGSSWSLFAETPWPNALATDDVGHLYAVDVPLGSNGAPGADRIVEYSATGERLLPSQAEIEENEGKEPGELDFFGMRPEFDIRGLGTSNACNLQNPDLVAAYSEQFAAQLIAYGPNPDPAVCPPPARPPAITDQFSTSVQEHGAVLQARVNSRFWASTTTYVEYGTEPCTSGGCTAEPVPPGVALNSSSNIPALTPPIGLSGLLPGTTYHYRFVARTVFEPGPGGEAEVKGVGGEVGSDGAEAEFTTTNATLPAGTSCPNQGFRTLLSATLPDCRAYEMVSPVDKEGGDIVTLASTIGYPARLDQSAESGDKLTYSSYRPFDQAPSAPTSSQYLASRTAGVGWSTAPISPPFGRSLVSPGKGVDREYTVFSSDLCRGWFRLTYLAEPVLDPAAVPHNLNLYRRENCGGSAGSYEALTTLPPPHKNAIGYEALELQGVSSDGGTAVYVASDNLPGTKAPPINGPEINELPQLYVRGADGTTRYACILPDGLPAPTRCAAGDGGNVGGLARVNQVDGAVSADGRRLFFVTGKQLYLRENPLGNEAECTGGPDSPCTIAIPEARVPAEGVVLRSPFLAAAADGSRVLFTTEARALREYDVETAISRTIAPSGVLGVLGQSRDATRVYFASTSVLSGPNPEGKAPIADEPNLYFHEVGRSNRFIATLSEADVGSGIVSERGEAKGTAAVTSEPINRATRVSPDGLAVTFVSVAPLTGFNNTDVETGEAAGEVFLYDAEAEEEEGQLVCVSCDPAGARPVGHTVRSKAWLELVVAAWIPTWESDLYASRVLTEDEGRLRLFFNSFVSLVPRDGNGKQDVYEWESAQGKAECEAIGAERFVPSSGGCLSLISSGQGNQDSEFLDADPTGRDVFFNTGVSLLPQDPGLIDIYDARVEGGLPEPPGIGPECKGQACQGEALPPGELGTASEGFHGAGNVRRKVCPKGKHMVRGKRHKARGHNHRPKGRHGRKHRSKGSRRAKRRGTPHCVRDMHRKKHRRHHRRGHGKARGAGR